MIEKTEVVMDAWGSIESVKQVSVKKVTPETFWQVYLENNDEFFKLTMGEYRTLVCVLQLSTYYEDSSVKKPGNEFKFDKSNLYIIIDKTGLSEPAIRKSIASLVKKGMLLKNDKFRGIYYTNPKYFFKGTINNRTKLVTQITQYEFEVSEDED